MIRAFRVLLHGFVDLELGHGFGLARPVDVSFDVALDLLRQPLADERKRGASRRELRRLG